MSIKIAGISSTYSMQTSFALSFDTGERLLMAPCVYTFCLDLNSEGINFLEPKLVKVSSTFLENIFTGISFRLNLFAKVV